MSGTVVITGASAGVGRATAVAFGRRGWRVGLLARGGGGLDAAAKEVDAAGGTPCTVPVDVADAADVDGAADALERRFGPIDVWVNNAMVTVFGRIADVSAAEIERVTRVTYLGQVHGTLAALHRMRPRDRGVIVNVGSALAFVSIPLQGAYCASKFAVRGFTEALRTELLAEGSNVKVTMVHLPAVNTPQFGWCRSLLREHPQPVPPIYQPEVAAEAIVRAALRPRRAKILGSWNTMIVQLHKLAPGVVSHYAALTAVDGQLAPDKGPAPLEDDLYEPVDREPGSDHGAHGVFDDRAGGVLDPAFVRSTPRTVAAAARAAVRRTREVLG